MVPIHFGSILDWPVRYRAADAVAVAATSCGLVEKPLIDVSKETIYLPLYSLRSPMGLLRSKPALLPRMRVPDFVHITTTEMPEMPRP